MYRSSLLAFVSFIVLVLSLTASSPTRAQLIRVPGDVAGLQQAINQIGNGGTIELAAGVYPAPPGSFRITNSNARKNFTIRAAAGAQVILSGGGTESVLRFETTPDRAGRVFFRGLTFADGFSADEKKGGAVSLIGARAVFVDCRFDNSVAAPATTGGGGVLVFDGSIVSFVGSTWSGNSSPNRGGGLSVVNGSTVYIHRGTFVNNRVNLPGHKNGSPGGGIYILNSLVRISESLFEGNEAGWVGGGIYAFGNWTDESESPKEPATDVLITGSTFRNNRARPDSCCPTPGPTVGGAIHGEDQVTVRIDGSRFEENRAEQGGAINNYRSVTEIRDSVFEGNLATGASGVAAVGGALYANSQDFSDGTTNFGAINRRASRVTIADSLFRGRSGATTIGAQDGACLFFFGDLNRRFGDFVPAAGSSAQNRTRVTIERSLFHDCDTDLGPDGIGGFGGGISARFTDLTVRDSLFLDSDSLPEAGGGGAMALFQETVATITGTTFAGNTAFRGGGLFLSGSELAMDGCGFFGNVLSPGVNEASSVSRGAAIFSIPATFPSQPERAVDVSGVIANTLFSANVGIPVFEVDRNDPPINRLQYDGNRFFNTTFGTRVFTNILLDRDGSTVGALNSAIIARSGAPSTDKSLIANSSLGSAPAAGSALAVPRTLSGFGEVAPESYLGLAFTRTPAQVNGQNLTGVSDLRTVSAAGTYTLRVANQDVASAEVGAESCTGGSLLCLNGDRYLLDAVWKDFQNNVGVGEGVPLTSDTGYFFFFNPSNVELVTKVLDARGLNGHYWLFYGALSNVEYTLRALDTQTGQLNVYLNPRSNFASVGDTMAFPNNAGKGAGMTLLEDPVFLAGPETLERIFRGSTGGCNPTATRLCLRGGRFAVEIEWRDFQSNTGVGMAETLTSDTGYFWFFRDTNVEVIVKVLDGRPLNGHFWVFYGALSNVEYTLRVTDTETGMTATYFNPLRNFASVGDTSALPSP